MCEGYRCVCFPSGLRVSLATEKKLPVCRQGQTEAHPSASRAPGKKLNSKSIALEPSRSRVFCVCACGVLTDLFMKMRVRGLRALFFFASVHPGVCLPARSDHGLLL